MGFRKGKTTVRTLAARRDVRPIKDRGFSCRDITDDLIEVKQRGAEVL
jgi:hypothetical protein